ncbi:MAG: trehalose-6-phosphate synthase [Nitrospirae bacterium CG_4_10_14_0_8_um_filter_41_23]|nr:MAG: trehalose-6-phosphate synthase [Nitrospirae bacterium CG_4_10_14_0_8_um_filter_41_23]PJA79251.1 MAG: trehalose-6-phosphate synthase [Nitrospirae bacterium CG_4_9_14_3_um_filter_41_27]
MKITIRLIVSLIFIVALVAVGFSFYEVRAEKMRMTADLQRRAIILAKSLQESVVPLVQSNSLQKLNRLVERFGNRERLEGVAVYDQQGNVLALTPDLALKIPQPLPLAVKSVAENQPVGSLMRIDDKETYFYALPFSEEDKITGTLVLFHDASYIGVRLEEIWKNNLLRFVILSTLIALITLLAIRWSITGPIARVAEWMRELRMGRGKMGQSVVSPRGDVLAPLISEVTHLAKNLAMAHAKKEDEAKLRLRTESVWTAGKLKEHIRAELSGNKIFLVSNREPYMHIREGSSIKCIVPAGGLVTALDPVMRVCEGVWIANGSGYADRDVVDGNDKLRVPPEDPAYTLKRVWLTKEEENGYYYGFSNEGLWPLCHITHTRPLFHLEDWIQYQRTNEKFAETLFKEIENEESPLILIQDYHFALLPMLIKSKRPDARVSLFWHIPWPNPESYGICPWREEILIGMLGANILSFHIQFHCNNFLDTVDRFLESKVDWEQFSITRGGHTTLVKPFPISVDFNGGTLSKAAATQERASIKEKLFREIGAHAKYMGVGVDRIDYTKGIPERFTAIERFLEKYPEFGGEFTFVELGAPSRTHIKRYRDLTTEVEEMVDRINWRFHTKTWVPIVFLKGHHSHKEIYPFYKVADICMVTSLHDGMNLVAKEFVSSRDDEDGVLILSQFTGASRELKDAVIVNPYDIEGMADAIFLSLKMTPDERSERMKRMREVVKEHNIYRWAGDLITALARLRLTETIEQQSE